VSLIARYLESQAIPTLCLVSARDIIEAGRPPRAAFVDYPLGHTAGKAFDKQNQLDIITDALRCFESIQTSGEIVDLDYQWPEPDWQSKAMQADAGDTRSARDESPQWQFEADRLLAQR
jgi:hypothetical protein